MTANRIAELEVKEAEDLFDILQSFPTGWIGDNRRGTWIYRGQTNADWSLETTFDRVRKIHYPKQKSRKGKAPEHKALNDEVLLVRRFKRQAHLYVKSPPAPDAHLEWRALLRHHYGPSRLMDWTYSPYVATFFALCDALGSAKPSALWAINKNWLARCEAQYLRRIGLGRKEIDFDAPDTFKGVFLKSDLRTDGMVIAANPYYENERLQLQQGLFLIPLRMDISFEDNLINMDKNEKLLDELVKEKSTQDKLKLLPKDKPRSSPIRKFILTPDANEKLTKDTLRRLRKMNITTASLFPGLDGFARSLDHWPLFGYNVKNIAYRREGL